MTRLADIDWKSWRAVDPATLVFVMRGDEILLIHKKTGLGKGKVNGPGGKIDPGETAEQCAARECHEELEIEVSDLECCGEHKFQFLDGYSIHCFVFRTTRFAGVAVETIEATPLWVPIARIPYDRMWEDDRIWLPKVIGGQYFRARWVFDDDRMLEHEIDDVPAVALSKARHATRNEPCID
jgi:8-oxo-dGTP diphosphatase